ncbi:MAG: uroporphyrinogen decarboxylase [Gemmatimonadetes bacterium]|nr:uroporphyrinogen decarboxylase [Gemmatimonadota bacterium]
MRRGERFLAACRGEAVDRTPVWLMRQAGRYLPEYRAIRARHSLLDICGDPELATEVTLQPLRLFELDAAIVFADILLPLVPMGARLEFAAGEGPLIHNPVRSPADVPRLLEVDPRRDLAHVLRTVERVAARLEGLPLIGFAGAPFTLASYLVEGGPSRHHARTKTFLLRHPAAWHDLMARLAAVTGAYLRAQVEAGASAVQMFDSWVGALSPTDYERHVLPYSRLAIEEARASGAPVLHFGTNTAGFLELMHSAGADVLGIDWRVRLDDAWTRLGPDARLQGNLDPVALLGPVEEAEARAHAVLEQAGGRRGHVFNLGHGILPETPPENVRAVVDAVHAVGLPHADMARAR